MRTKTIKKLLSKMVFIKPILEMSVQILCSLSVTVVSLFHKILLAIQWGIPPHPEHFDHYIDLFYQWRATRNSLWLERGVFGGLALKGGTLLELSCGDGFNTRNFYSLRSTDVIACDFDSNAIKTANKKNRAPNIQFVLADIRYNMPQGNFDNIVWDAAIEHFTQEEIHKILEQIKKRLIENGILSGYSIVEKKDGTKSLEEHEYEFKSKEDLMCVFTPYFKNVTVFETVYPNRHNLYFWASDGVLPFSYNWPNAITNENSELNISGKV